MLSGTKEEENMKRFAIWVGVILAVTMLVLLFGCSSPAAKAQKMFNEGKFQEIITQFGNDPNVSTIVAQAKEKLASQWVTEGKYDSVLAMYPETMAAKDAKEKLAEQLFNNKQYTDVIAKYPETSWATKAKAELDKQAANPPGGVSAAKEKAAQAELYKIMKIKMKDLRTKSLKAFVAKPEYAGTKAVVKAQKELGH
jgi:hypothetical protein